MGGRPAGRAAAMPGTALLCGRVLCPPPLCPLQACSGPIALPATRPAPTLHPPRVPSPSGPRPPGLGSCSRPGRPAMSSVPPPLAPPGCPRSAASLARCQAAWEPGLGWGTFRRGCVWEGCGVRWCQGRERPRCPAAAPTPQASPCLLSPESHKGTDNTGGLVKTVVYRSRQTNKSPYLFI